MATNTTHPPSAAERETPPPDIATMRETVQQLLGPDDGPDVLPPAMDELDALTGALRGHLEVLIPEVERAVGSRPSSTAHYCALACVGEARGKLSITPRADLGSRVAHGRRLARSLRALCTHYEELSGDAQR
ncbi:MULTISPECIES: DUF6415 family natural product biosynthesis protein [unclassified Streptomyces]|uniref:DUF6415 family natural product biosynthesis protein n=1 Tax=unclassified Streptomyces TaxID=2593676 RepID=UPI0013E8F328|nr:MULTISPECIES: DUF6415 family natural product biosynthesis protein [unclassified Streptomyces]